MVKKLLDLGCGVRKRNEALGIDIIQGPCVDIIHDLNKYPYPLQDNTFDDILMDNSLEHLNDVVKTMEEVWRISKSGAKITIKVPYFRSPYAYDPTHRHYFVTHSFYYFQPGHEFHRLYKYSNKAFFKVEKLVFDEEYAYSFLNKLIYGMVKLFANRYPNKYEMYFSHLVPLHSITYYLTVLNK